MFQVPGLTLFQPVLGPNTFLRLSVNIPYVVWLVVSTPLKNISQLGLLLFPIYGKINIVFQTTKQNSINLHCCWLNRHGFPMGFPMVFLSIHEKQTWTKRTSGSAIIELDRLGLIDQSGMGSWEWEWVRINL